MGLGVQISQPPTCFPLVFFYLCIACFNSGIIFSVYILFKLKTWFIHGVISSVYIQIVIKTEVMCTPVFTDQIQAVLVAALKLLALLLRQMAVRSIISVVKCRSDLNTEVRLSGSKEIKASSSSDLSPPKKNIDQSPSVLATRFNFISNQQERIYFHAVLVPKNPP